MNRLLKVFVLVVVVFGYVSLFAQDPLIAKAQDFVKALSRGDYQKAYLSLSSDLGFKVKPENLEEVWKQLTSKAGNFVDFRDAKSEFKNDYTLVIAVCKFEKGLVDLHIAVNNMGYIAGFQIKDHKSQTPQSATSQPQPAQQSG